MFYVLGMRQCIARRRYFRLSLLAFTTGAITYMLINLLLLNGWDTWSGRLGRDVMLDTRYMGGRLFSELHRRRSRLQGGGSQSRQHLQARLQQLTKSAYLLGVTVDIEYDSKRFLWIWPIGDTSWLAKAAVYNQILKQISTTLTRADQGYFDTARTALEAATHSDVLKSFQSIATTIWINKRRVRLVFLGDANAFPILSKMKDVTTIFLGWGRNRSDVVGDYYGYNAIFRQSPNLPSTRYQR